MSDKVALIVGAGSGLSAALARRCAARGMIVQLAARNTAKLGVLADEINASVYCCDVSLVLIVRIDVHARGLSNNIHGHSIGIDYYCWILSFWRYH